MLLSKIKLKYSFCLLFLVSIFVFLIFWHIQSLYSLILVGFLCFLFAKIFDFEYIDVFLLYFAYVFIAMLVFYLLNLIIPQFKGFTGDLGFGTDDLYFFDQVAGFNPVYNHEVRPGSYLNLHNFSKFLKVYAYLIPYKLHPIDMLIFNIFPLTFIPNVLMKISRKLFGVDRKLTFLFIISAICPFTMMNGLVLIRDAWIAFFFIMLLWGVFETKYILIIFMLSLMGFLRFDAMLLSLFLAGIIAFSLILNTNETVKNKIEGIISEKKHIIIICLFILVVLVSFAAGTILFRSEFVTGFLTEDVAVKNRTSVYYKIFNSVWYFRLPLGFAFFWGAPFITLKNLFVNDIFVLRGVFEQLFGILFIFYIPIYFQSLFSTFQKKAPWIVRGLHISYLLGILLLSQMSLQVRHKTMLMPLFYLILYTGLISENNLGKRVGIFISIILFAVSIVVNYKFFI